MVEVQVVNPHHLSHFCKVARREDQNHSELELMPLAKIWKIPPQISEARRVRSLHLSKVWINYLMGVGEREGTK